MKELDIDVDNMTEHELKDYQLGTIEDSIRDWIKKFRMSLANLAITLISTILIATLYGNLPLTLSIGGILTLVWVLFCIRTHNHKKIQINLYNITRLALEDIV